MADPPRLDVVIVNWNSGEQLAACLRSIEAGRLEGVDLTRVVVVDNGSTDGSADLPQTALPLVVLRNENVGFGAGCNRGARDSEADYLLFMNPDVEVRSDTLALAVTWLDSAAGQGVGIVGVRFADGAGAVQRTCARFPTPARMAARSAGLDLLLPRIFHPHFMVEWDHESSREVDQVMGAFFLIRAPLFRRLEGFDERFFLYWEDVDLALRARKAGWSCYYLSSAEAYHRGGGTTDAIRAKRLALSLRSRLSFARKHFTTPEYLLVGVAALAAEPVTRIAGSLLHGDVAGAIDVAKAYLLLAKGG